MVKRWLSHMARILRLWAMYAKMDFLLVARDLKLFLTWAVSDLVLNVAGLLGLFLLAERFAGIGTWTKDQILFLLGYGAAADGVLSMFFGYNIAYISRRLGRGQFDHTLIQPQPIWMSLLTEGFSPAFGLPVLLPGIGLMMWSVRSLSLHVSPAWLGFLLLNLVASAAVILAFQFLWGSLAFYAPRSAEEINSSTLSLMSQLRVFPLDNLGAFLTGSLLTVLPVGFVAWRPAQALLGAGGPAPVSLWQTPLASLVFWLMAAVAFTKGFRHYVRVGSSRYSSFGHRR
jgi:ABC-2 type transport system permease protein